jgi:hypothetical protein
MQLGNLAIATFAMAQDTVTPTSTAAALIMSSEMQNDARQGGDQQACRFRDAELYTLLGSRLLYAPSRDNPQGLTSSILTSVV